MNLDELLAEYGESVRRAASERALLPLEQLVPSRRRGWPGWCAAAAAAMGLIWLAAPPSGGPAAEVAAVPVTKPAPVVLVPEAAAPLARRGVRLRAGGEGRTRARRTMRPPATVAERRFVPLAENSMLPPPAFLQLVRVSVRRDRLAELGIAAQGVATPGALVEADVLLGDDGIARALRVPGGE